MNVVGWAWNAYDSLDEPPTIPCRILFSIVFKFESRRTSIPNVCVPFKSWNICWASAAAQIELEWFIFVLLELPWWLCHRDWQTLKVFILWRPSHMQRQEWRQTPAAAAWWSQRLLRFEPTHRVPRPVINDSATCTGKIIDYFLACKEAETKRLFKIFLIWVQQS